MRHIKWLLITACILLAACGGSAPTSTALLPTPTVPRKGGNMSTSTGNFTNPVYDSNFPDPFVLKEGDTYYAFSTTSGGKHYPTLISKDLVHWEEGPDAMPEMADWTAGNTWAPEVLKLHDGLYLMYYTAEWIEVGLQCIGIAESRRPLGPYVDRNKRPFICQQDEGGSIDADPFRDDDGSLYLYWKNDGNRIGMNTYIYGVRLSPNGRRMVGKPKRLLAGEPNWEINWIEAPFMWKHEVRYYLFYSANAYNTPDYAVGYAICEGPLGPCRKGPENPILRSKCAAAGPGHNSVTVDKHGRPWFVYHAWHPDAIGSIEPGRVLWIDRLVVEHGKAKVLGPTCHPQPIP